MRSVTTAHVRSHGQKRSLSASFGRLLVRPHCRLGGSLLDVLIESIVLGFEAQTMLLTGISVLARNDCFVSII